ncbi:MAG: hypothetical protein ACRERU_06810 [Methylococcales bacterium]
MQKKRTKTPQTSRPGSDNKAPRSRFETSLKWVGSLTALLSLIFGLHQAIQLVSEVRERQRLVAELYETGKLQQGAADYDGAWDSFDQALKTAESGGNLAKLTGQLDEATLQIREAQENLAMAWLENVHASPGQTFSAVADKLLPVLNRGVTSASGIRKADLLAHVGWANFLRARDGHATLNPEQQYRQSLEIDSANPYAHVYWGYWKLWGRKELEDAKQHFSAALASGRVRDYVRDVQLAALKNIGSEHEGEFLRVVHELWKNHEKIDPMTRHDVDSIYYFACAGHYDNDSFQNLLAAVPGAEQLAMFQSLFSDKDVDALQHPGREACLATLLEAAGQPEEALQIWMNLRSKFPPASGSNLGAGAAIKRLSPNRK